MKVEAPGSAEEAAEVLRVSAAEGRSVRLRGGGTKLEWGTPTTEPDAVLSTGSLGRILEHNAADLTAVIEAGVPLAAAQTTFAQEGQMLALDPPLGGSDAATVGGVVATGDSGPLRNRYGAPRDLLLGMTVALSDGTVAKSGGKVIKNVAGYDLAKLFAGSFGTLGLITQVAVRLHPLPSRRVSAVGHSEDPETLQRAAISLGHSPLELESLDVLWRDGRGSLLARCAGVAPEPLARRAVRLMLEAGLEAETLEEGDVDLWQRQRSGQRSAEGILMRVSALPSELARVIDAAQGVGGSLVGRAGLGLSWLTFDPGGIGDAVSAVEDLRHRLAPLPCVVLDSPRDVRAKVDVWGSQDGPALELMRRVKAGFDPAGVCNPGVYVGGI